MAVQRVVLGKVAGPKGERGNPGERGPLPIIQAEAGPNINVTGTPAVTVRDIEGGASFVFNYLKGEKGDKGDPGESIVGPQGAPGTAGPAGPAPDVTVAPGSDTAQVGTPSVSSVQDPVTGLVTLTFHQLKGETGQQGIQGIQGPEGPAGSSIASITKTGEQGLVDTYTITLTNGNTTTFQVTNGVMSAAQFGYANQGTEYANFYGEAGVKTINVTIPSNSLPMDARCYDHDGVPMYIYGWRRSSATNVQVIVELDTTLSSDDDCTAYVDYVTLS